MPTAPTQSIQNLMTELSRLPGIGPRSAERIAFHLLKQRPEEALKLAEAIREVKTRIRHCSICYNLTESDPCAICANPARDQGLVCIVEQPKDLLALEGAGGLYNGAYHVLLGRISPLEGIGPEDLTIAALEKRLEGGSVREVIMGTNPTMEGDGTALHLQQIIAHYPQVAVTRLARGLATGSSIEYANRNVLADAISGRQKM